MTILEKYIAGLNSGDANQVAELFIDDCKFDDGGARPFGFDDLCVQEKKICALLCKVFLLPQRSRQKSSNRIPTLWNMMLNWGT